MGRLVVARQPERRRCELPEERYFPPGWVDTLPSGSRYFCDCGQVWIVRWVPSRTVGGRRIVGHHEWCHESRREARQRLRLRWWQRVPRFEAAPLAGPPPKPRRPDPGRPENERRRP